VTMGGQGKGRGRCAPVVVAPGRPGTSVAPRVAPPGWVRDSESMGGRAIGAGGGGPPMASTDRGRRTYHPGPLTLRYDCARGAMTVIGPADHEHIWIKMSDNTRRRRLIFDTPPRSPWGAIILQNCPGPR
jgi:hypothetical protein